MTVRVEKDGPVTTIVIDRPDVRNAVNWPTAKLLADAFREFEADPEAKVVVFCGAGGTFCAGADLKAVSQAELSAPRLDGDGPMGPSRMVLSKPSIAAVSGYAVAGGLELSLICDMRVVEEDAVFGVFCRRWGVPLIDGGTVRLPRLIGLGHAMDMILTGRPVGAEEARMMGLANRVVPKGQARAAAEELARQLAAFPQACMNADRNSALRQGDLSFEAAMRNEYISGWPMVAREGRAGAARFAAGAGRHGSFKATE
jgi:enoyl-CoA hydratase